MRARVKGINLLPREYIQAEQIKLVQMVISAVLVLEVVAFIGGVAIPPKAEIRQVQEQLDEASSKLNDSRFTDVNKTIQALEAAKVEVEEWVKKYGNLKAENFISARVLDSLTARLPLGMAIDTISIKPGEANGGNKEIVMEGSSDELESILNYATILEGIYGPDTVYYDGSYNKELKVYKYNLKIKIPVVVEAAAEATPAPTEGEAPPADATTAPADATTPPTESTEGGAN